MATRLIKKQLGSILLKNLLVPRMSKPTSVEPLTRQSINKYGIKENGLSDNDDYFVGKMSTGKGQSVPYIYKTGHPMTYKSDTKDGRHHTGEARMKHISNIKEFKRWYCNGEFNVLASLRQFSQSLSARMSAPANDTESLNEPSDKENKANNEDSDGDA